MSFKTKIFNRLMMAAIAAIFTLTLSSLAMGQVVAGWNTSGLTAYGPSPFAPTTTAANVTVVGLTRGAGVTTVPTAAARGWGGNGWDNGTTTASTAAQNIAANKFFTYSVKANTGFTLSLSSINPFDYRRSGTGASNGLIQYQINSGNFVDVTTVSFSSSAATGGSVGSTDLSGISALQNLPATSTVTFRIVPFGATAAAGTFYIYDVAVSTANDFAVNGTVTAVAANPTVNLSVSPNSGTEADATAITVTATASSAVTGNQTVALGVSGTGITTGDYTLSNTTITIPSGQTTGSVTFTIVDDALVEGMETATLTISNPSAGITLGTPTTQNITITDNDVAPAPSFAINSISAAEGDMGTTAFTFTVTKTGANGSASTVNFATVDGTATAGIDYTATSGTLNFADGNTSQPITVAVTGDYNIEDNETFFVNLTAGTNAAIGTAQGTGTITNDDAAGTVQFNPAAYSAAENSGILSFTVTRTGGLGSGVTVTATPANGTATGGATCAAGVDFVNTPSVVMFSGGQTSQTFSVTICNDAIFESDEAFTVALSTPTGGVTIGSPATATATITNDDTAPTFTISDVSQSEGNIGTTNFVFTVTKNGASDLGATVDYTTADGTATIADNDYAANSGTLTFLAADTTKTITVTVNGDTTVEPDETFFVNLSNATGATIADAQGLGTITNDDAANPTVNLSVSSNSGSESGATVITVTATLTGGTSAMDQTVTLGTSGTATLGSDYTLTGGNLSGTTLTIPANATSGSTTFTVIDDTVQESTETATLTISNPSAGITLGATVSQSISITDNDVAPAFTSANSTAFTVGTASSFTVTTSGSPTVTTITSSGALPSGVTFVNNGDGTATLAGTPASGTAGSYPLTFTASNGVSPDATQNFTLTVTTTDTTAPVISYTPLPAKLSEGTSTLNVTVTDNVAVQSVSLTYAIGNGAPTTVNCPSNSGSAYSCIISETGAQGQTISYYVTAADTSNNSSSLPAANMPDGYAVGGSTVQNGTYTDLNLNGGSLGGNVLVLGTFNFNDLLLGNGNTLEIGCDGQIVRGTNFAVITSGIVKKDLCAPQVFTFPVGSQTILTRTPDGSSAFYTPVTANITAATNPSSLTVSVVDSFMPGSDNANSVSRYWNLVEGGSITADLSFTYDQSDVNGNEAAYRVIKNENGTTSSFLDSTNDPTTNTTTVLGISNFSLWSVGSLSPTAANADISGRVVNTHNRGLENVAVTLSGGSLTEPITVTTNSVGRYRFSEVPAGDTYILTVTSKRHTFAQPSQVFTVNGSLTNLNFVGEGW